MRLIRRAGTRPMPWKNGGGVTHEIAVWPEGAGFDDFIWRLSMAEVGRDGPFSALPGIDRTLTLIEGAGIALDFGGAAVTLTPGAPPLAFPGEAPVTGRLQAGPILDLNVMTRRGRVAHQVVPLAAGALVPDTLALVARGTGRVGETALDPGDCVLAGAPFGGAWPEGLTATGDLLAIRLTELPGNRAG